MAQPLEGRLFLLQIVPRMSTTQETTHEANRTLATNLSPNCALLADRNEFAWSLPTLDNEKPLENCRNRLADTVR